MKKIITGLLLVGLAFTAGFAQNNKRIEIQTKKSADEYAVVPVGQEGVVAFSELSPGKITFTRFDTTLALTYTVDCAFNRNLSMIDHFFYDNYLYLLLGARRKTEYQVVRLSVTAGFAERFDFYSIRDVEVAEFKAIGNDVYISARTKNEPVLLHVNLITRKTRVLPAAFKGKTQIQSMEIDNITKQINVAFANQYKNEYKIIVKSFGKEGEEVKQSQVTAPKDKRLLNGKLTSMKAREDLIIGTFGLRSSGSKEYSQGMYFSKVNLGQPNPVFTRFYSFTDFQNFFKGLPPRDRDRKERQAQKAKKKGSDLKLDYRLLVHDVIEKDDQYIVVAESYYPTYRNNNNYYNGFGSPFGISPFYSPFGGFYSPYYYGNPWNMRNNQIFDGFQYTHAVIAGFNKEGKLLWDNVLELNDVKLMTLKEQVKVSFSGDNIILAYSIKGRLKSKIIRGNQVVEGKEDIPIATEFSDDKVRKNQVSNIEFWYDNYFLAWGFQRISNNKNQEVRGTRNVLYCNKVGF
jgi:hypothetical protein